MSSHITRPKHSDYYWDYLMRNPFNVGKKILVMFAGRSGSMMLSGLLDGHSHLLSFNYWVDGWLFVKLKSELFIFHEKKYVVSTQDFRSFLRKNIESLFKQCFYDHPYLTKSTKMNVFHYIDFLENVDLMCDRLSRDEIDCNLAYNIIYIAYGKAQNHRLNTTTPHMIIQVHGPHADLEDIFMNLDNASFFVTTRNTIKALDSYFSLP